jgi:GntR family transcriptional regulator/MocR family aminotransferase
MDPVFSFPLELVTARNGQLATDLHRQLKNAIFDGRLPAGTTLPAQRRVAAALGIARNTVVGAYDLLVAEGYVLPRPGAKAIVADVAVRRTSKKPRPAMDGQDARICTAWRTPALMPELPRQLPPRSFRVGIPEHRFFPHEVWRRLSAQSLRTWSKSGFSYPPAEGIAELRQAIASHVAFARAVVCTADDVVVTSGAQQAFSLLARLLVTPHVTRVAVEEPCYPALRKAFIAAGAQLVHIPVDDEGLCVDQLPSNVGIICVSPSHQSPTGTQMSLQRRAALLRFARNRNAVVIEDDYDGEFRFDGRPLDALQTMDRDGLVFYVGTFSKSLFPSLRKGFVVAPEWAKDTLVTVKQCVDGHCDALTQSILAAFIRDGHLARHVRRMQPIYQERRQALQQGLARELSPWLAPIPGEAGLHLCARILRPELAQQIMTHARVHAPGCQSTAEYAMGPLSAPAVTLGYGVMDAVDIGPALRRWRKAMEGKVPKWL